MAVAHELKKQQPNVQIIYVGQRGDGLADLPTQDESIDDVKLVYAGKFRRYHGEGLRQLLDLPTLLKNIRDAFLVIVGVAQSFLLLRKLRPDVIFIKGGFVGVPVGLSAAVLKIPYVTHDSDALPGLANRIVAPWAKKHAVAMPKEIYNYPQDKTVTVGVPLSRHFKPFSRTEVRDARQQIGSDPGGKLLLITGGGLGARFVNDVVAACVPALLERYPDLTIVQIAGRRLEANLRQKYQKKLPKADQHRIIVKGFVSNLYTYSGAADVIITRAGATSIAEFAAQQKACIVIPNPLLTGGHQLKNAQVLADRAAVRLIPEDKLRRDKHALMPPLVDLLDDSKRAKQLGHNLGTLSEPDSAKRLAMLLLEQAA